MFSAKKKTKAKKVVKTTIKKIKIPEKRFIEACKNAGFTHGIKHKEVQKALKGKLNEVIPDEIIEKSSGYKAQGYTLRGYGKLSKQERENLFYNTKLKNFLNKYAPLKRKLKSKKKTTSQMLKKEIEKQGKKAIKKENKKTYTRSEIIQKIKKAVNLDISPYVIGKNIKSRNYIFLNTTNMLKQDIREIVRFGWEYKLYTVEDAGIKQIAINFKNPNFKEFIPLNKRNGI